ncbi:hypothetical protein KY290_017648 [Solanum tuberosum]|uniref:DUF4216 domain-containing protein n=1 Tax=Solanum tuberosum TaxID=4113 RepID=A0ABQ7VES5_SOLTU|nr:hypothetical protein KY290_017648 [Solanum tuberosum]
MIVMFCCNIYSLLHFVVAQLHKGKDSRIIEDLLSLSRGPTKYSTHSNGYVVNGYRFHVQDYDKKLRTQNCGIVVLGENDEDSENLDYYGVLTDVIELQFVMDIRVTSFRLDQASQVFYADDNSNKGWKVVRKTQPRDSYEIVEQMDDDIVGIRMMHKNFMTFEKGNLPSKSILPQSSVLVKKYIKEIETRKERGQGLKNSTVSTSQGIQMMHKNFMAFEKENIQINTSSPTSTNQVKKYTQEVETMGPGAIGKGQEKRIGSLSSSLGISEYEVGSFNQSTVFANDTPTK